MAAQLSAHPETDHYRAAPGYAALALSVEAGYIHAYHPDRWWLAAGLALALPVAVAVTICRWWGSRAYATGVGLAACLWVSWAGVYGLNADRLTFLAVGTAVLAVPWWVHCQLRQHRH